MNKTKRSILDSSLKLFNEHGLTNVSQRRITEFIKISPGNLTYHFKKKTDIYEALYFEFVDLIDVQIKEFLNQEINLRSFAQLTEKWFHYMYEYRFVFHDITNLMRMNLKISDSYLHIVRVRESLFLKTIDKLIAQNTIRKAELPNEYQYLYHRLHIVSDFYLSSVGVFEETIGKQQQHKRIFLHALYPYLTDQGRNDYQSIFKDS